MSALKSRAKPRPRFYPRCSQPRYTGGNVWFRYWARHALRGPRKHTKSNPWKFRMWAACRKDAPRNRPVRMITTKGKT